MSLTPYVGLALDGAHVTTRDVSPAALGSPVWGPRGLLTDLELRFGLGPLEIDPVARLVAARDWLLSARGDDPSLFFARSFDVDPWGTTRVMVALHDALSEAGWDYQEVPAGGPRLEVLREIVMGMPAGEIDRLVRLEAGLRFCDPPYPELILAEPASDWPGRWQLLFRALEGLGTAVRHEPAPRVAPSDDSTTDLALVQRYLSTGGVRPLLKGDGTFVLLRAETPEPLADAIAAIGAGVTRAEPGTTVTILRTADHGSLDAAFARHGMPRLGGRGAPGVPMVGAWLPLLVALARGPFDPEAAVDLLLLPSAGLTGSQVGSLSGALTRVPGLGNATWKKAMAELRESDPEAAARVDAWLRPSVATQIDDLDPQELARRVAMVDAVLAQRATKAIARARAEDEASTTAADALEAARSVLSAWMRALPTKGSIAAGPLDALLRSFGMSAASGGTRQEAGPIDRVDDPAALLAPTDTLIWWGFVDPGRPVIPEFQATERTALAAIGVDVPTPLRALSRQAAAYRAVVMRARRRLVLAFPERIAGTPHRIHPLWSELCGRLGWDPMSGDHDLARGLAAILGDAAIHEQVPPTRFASDASRWNVSRAGQPGLDLPPSISVSHLGTLLDCPLRFVLDRIGRIRERVVGQLPSTPALLGNLGHRFFETLSIRDILTVVENEAPLRAALDELIESEAAPLARSGLASERRAVTRRLLNAARQFAAWLTNERLTPIAAEEGFQATCGERTIVGRIDLRAETEAGEAVIVDFKWSTRSHEEALDAERAVQLASYVRAHQTPGRVPRAALFGLRDARAIDADPELLARAWQRVERGLPHIEAAIAQGRIEVTGVTDAKPLSVSLGFEGDASPPNSAVICKFCKFDLVCGRLQRNLRGDGVKP